MSIVRFLQAGSKRPVFGSTGAPSPKRNTAQARPQWAKDFDENGYAVIPDAISPELCDEIVHDLNKYYAAMGVDLNDPKAERFQKHGIEQHCEVGHSNAAWKARLSGVEKYAAEMHGTNNIVVSFDGVGVMAAGKKYRDKTLTHFDQGPRTLGLHWVQGFLVLTDATDCKTGTLAVIPGSHKKHAGFWEKFPEDAKKCGPKNFFKFDKDEHARYLTDDPTATIANLYTKTKRVFARKGSYVIFRSDLAHQARPPTHPVMAERLARYVVYLCFSPRRLLTPKLLEKKKKAFDEYRMTSHDPIKVKLFSKLPRTYGRPVPQGLLSPARDRRETLRMLQLAGKEDMPEEEIRTTTPLLQFDY